MAIHRRKPKKSHSLLSIETRHRVCFCSLEVICPNCLISFLRYNTYIYLLTECSVYSMAFTPNALLLEREVQSSAECRAFFSTDMRQMISRVSVLLSLMVYNNLQTDVHFVSIFVSLTTTVIFTTALNAYLRHDLLLVDKNQRKLIARLWFEVLSAFLQLVTDFFNYLLIVMIGDRLTRRMTSYSYQLYHYIPVLLAVFLYLTVARLLERTLTVRLSRRQENGALASFML